MMPTHNPTRDGNPFEWILRAAAEVRAERVAERETLALIHRQTTAARGLQAGKVPADKSLAPA
jgi:cytidylate kinase